MAIKYALVREDHLKRTQKVDNLTNRGEQLLELIQPAIKVRDGRVLYNDGEIGSYLTDLLKYFLSSDSASRPIDATKFAILLKELKVPESLLGRKLSFGAKVLKHEQNKEKKRHDGIKWKPLRS